MSPKSLFIMKARFPLVGFGLLAFFWVTSIVGGVVARNAPVLVLPREMGVGGYVLIKRLVWDLVDEV